MAEEPALSLERRRLFFGPCTVPLLKGLIPARTLVEAYFAREDLASAPHQRNCHCHIANRCINIHGVCWLLRTCAYGPSQRLRTNNLCLAVAVHRSHHIYRVSRAPPMQIKPTTQSGPPTTPTMHRRTPSASTAMTDRVRLSHVSVATRSRGTGKL
jgi:hypothetical protein